MKMPGFALSSNPYIPGGWSYRQVASESDLVEGETFYATYDDFPQEVKDWFAANGP